MNLTILNYGLLLLFYYDFFTLNKLFLTDSLFIPFPICGLIGFYFLAINYNRLKLKYIAPLIGIYLTSIVTVFLAPSLDQYIAKRLIAIFQLIYSTLASFGYYMFLTSINKKIFKIFFSINL